MPKLQNNFEKMKMKNDNSNGQCFFTDDIPMI